MNLHYLSHLAELAETDVHPHGAAASVLLTAALDISEGDRLLEIGCGTAGTVARIAARHRVFIVGVDLLPGMLRVARQRLGYTRLQDRAAVLQASGSVLPFADERFDAIYTESVLGFQDADGARGMLAEIRRTLRPGGRYVANEAIWREEASSERIAAINAAALSDFGLRQASAQAWYLPDWLREMTTAGFEVRSSDSLVDRLAGLEVRPSEPFLSRLLTLFYRARGRLSLRLRWQRALYRRRLVAHSEDGRYIEARLFVLRKSA